jgi:hypothetical protein
LEATVLLINLLWALNALMCFLLNKFPTFRIG